MLRSGVRQEIVDALQASGARSIAELSTILGRAPDSLYYHIRQLLQIKILQEVEVRRSGRRDEKVFDVAAETIQLQSSKISPDSGVAEMVESALKLAMRDLHAAIDSGSAIARGARQNIAGGRHKAWLSKTELEQVQDHLSAIQLIYNQAKPGPKRKLSTFALVLCPATATERTRN